MVGTLDVRKPQVDLMKSMLAVSQMFPVLNGYLAEVSKHNCKGVMRYGTANAVATLTGTRDTFRWISTKV